jgi:hypothetical protein
MCNPSRLPRYHPSSSCSGNPASASTSASIAASNFFDDIAASQMRRWRVFPKPASTEVRADRAQALPLGNTIAELFCSFLGVFTWATDHL